MKSKSGWDEYGNSTDNYGFSALPGGRRYFDDSFYLAGNYGNWWTAPENGDDGAYGRGMSYGSDDVNEGKYDKSNGFSVRCVADNP